MSGCNAMQAKLSEYLDGRLTGREMQRIAAHLEQCRDCASEWTSLRELQSSLAALGAVPEPKDLLLRIRVAVSQERAKSKQRPFQTWNLTLPLLPASSSMPIADWKRVQFRPVRSIGIDEAACAPTPLA